MSAVTDIEGPASWRWIAVPAIFLAIAVSGFIGMSAAVKGIHENWVSVYGHFAHGYLVLLMSFWLARTAWINRPSIRIRPWWPALPLLVLILVLSGVAMERQSQTVMQSLVPVIVLAALGASAGLGMVRVLLWPVLFLYFGLPQWWILNLPLQQLTSAVVNGLVGISGVPAYVEGNYFHLAHGIIEIASLCSGLNYLVAAEALACFQGFLFLQRWRNRLKLAAYAASLALVCNWVRIYSLILVAHFTDMNHYLISVEHLYYGWVLFLASMIPVFLCGSRLERQELSLEKPPPSGGPSSAILRIDWSPFLLASGAVVLAVIAVPAGAGHVFATP